MRIVCLLAATITLSISGRSADWSQWRGPGGDNVAPIGESVPTEWSDSKNVLWKTNVPGRGHSSPVVVGDLVVLTSADEGNQTQAVVAFDRKTGQLKWLTPISRGASPGFISRILTLHQPLPRQTGGSTQFFVTTAKSKPLPSM